MISKWIKYDDVIKQIYSEEKTGVEMAQSILNIKANSKQNNDVKELGIPKGSPIDASHKNGKIVKEHRKENRARGGALKK